MGFCIRQTGAEFVLTAGVWKGFDYTAMARRVSETLEQPPVIVNAYDSLPEGDPTDLPAIAAAPSSPGEALVRWIYYTSGTTSDPKGVQHTDHTLISAGTGLTFALQPTSDDVGSIAYPYAHIGGPDYTVMMLVSGLSALLLEAFVPAEAVREYNRFGVTLNETAFDEMGRFRTGDLGVIRPDGHVN